MNEIANVPVIDCLSALLLIVTECLPSVARVSLPAGMYLSGIWLILMIKTNGLSYFSTLDVMSWRNTNSIFLRVSPAMSTFDEVFLRFTKFILVSKLLVQRYEYISISPSTLGYLLIRA